MVRTYLADSSVPVLDEATPAIDVSTERRIQQALYPLRGDGPRWSSGIGWGQSAPRIAVFENEHVLEIGPHDAPFCFQRTYVTIYGRHSR